MQFGPGPSGNLPGAAREYPGPGGAGGPRAARWLTRRAVLAGGIGATAVVALPDPALAAAPGRAGRPGRDAGPGTAGPREGAGAAAGSDASGHFFLYGITAPDSEHSAGVQAAAVPVPAARESRLAAAARHRPARLPGAARAGTSAKSPAAAAGPESAGGTAAGVPVAAGLASAPVVSPDRAWLAFATVAASDAGPVVTARVVARSSATVARRAALVLHGIPAAASVLVTPVFSPDASVLCLVLGISVPGPRRLVRKAAPPQGTRHATRRDPLGAGTVTMLASDWRSQHALAYIDRRTGAVAGPFYLGDEPSLALSTAVATASDLFLWTTPDPRAVPRDKLQEEPRDNARPALPPLPSVSVFPLGEGRPRLTVPSPAPWPAGEPAGALASGDAARLVNARTLQVVAAGNGDFTQAEIAPLRPARAKPAPATMTPRPDGTLFLAKPSAGRAVIVDPSRGFAVRRDIGFPAPARPFGGLPSKAVLSPDGARLYVLGGAASGGLAVYDVATGKLAGAYGDGRQYSGIYMLPSGTLLGICPDNPRLAYFSPELDPIGTADAGMYISAVY
jgi:hypothetical protein